MLLHSSALALLFRDTRKSLLTGNPLNVTMLNFAGGRVAPLRRTIGTNLPVEAFCFGILDREYPIFKSNPAFNRQPSGLSLLYSELPSPEILGRSNLAA